MHSFTSFDGTRIAYHDEGDGPAVILLHGFGTDGLTQYGDFSRLRAYLEKLFASFREHFSASPPLPDPPPEGKPGLIARLRQAGARVIVPDQRGFGASDHPCDAAVYANSAMARDVIALMKHLNLEAADVLGFSMGSQTVAKLLSLDFAGVRSAILAGVADFILEGEVLHLPENFPLPGDPPRQITMRAHAEGLATALERDAITPGDPRSFPVIAARASISGPKVQAAVVRGASTEMVPPEALAKVRVPVLILNGTEDVANQVVRRLLEVIPHAKAASCAGDHGNTPHQPSFQQAVVDFFAAQWPSRAAPGP
jgi:pimeloyl-ACP methyl ester carboxylesterase